MARFLLQPCKLREDRIVPTKDDPIEYSWPDLLARFAPSRSTKAKIQLRAIQRGAFVGLTRQARTQELSNFVLLNPNRKGQVGWLLKRDPAFAERLVEVFQVEAVSWDDRLEEFSSPQAA